MTALPATTAKKLGLVIDLDTCVGCQACATSCKEWNTGGYSAPLTDQDPYGADPHGAWLNRVHGYEVGEGASGRTVHFPRSCLHCEEPACVTVCPTGASYKRAEDGIVLVDPDTCIGCKLCSWACPYGAREYDYDDGVMKKCTLCVDRIYNDTCPRRIASRPACAPARRARATSATSAIPPAPCPSWWPSAAASICCPSSATSRSTSTCRRARAATDGPRSRRATTAEPAGGATGAAADKLFAWVDRMLSR